MNPFQIMIWIIAFKLLQIVSLLLTSNMTHSPFLASNSILPNHFNKQKPALLYLKQTQIKLKTLLFQVWLLATNRLFRCLYRIKFLIIVLLIAIPVDSNPKKECFSKGLVLLILPNIKVTRNIWNLLRCLRDSQ